MGQEEITYLTANYNNGRYFHDMISSLEVQTDPNWFCLVCDDASADDSYALIEQRIAVSPVRDRIRLFRNEVNLGYPGTLKRLLTFVETDIVQFLDPDDALMPDATEWFLKIYHDRPGVSFLHAKLIRMDASLTVAKDTIGSPPPSAWMMASSRPLTTV